MTAIVKEKTYMPLGFFVFDPLGDLEFFREHSEAAAHADRLVEKYRSDTTEEFHDEAAEAVMVGIVLSFPGAVGKMELLAEMDSAERITRNH